MKDITEGIRRSVIVGADRGGVSKTLVSAALVDSILARKGRLRLVEYEVEPRIDQIVGGLADLGLIENRAVSAEANLAMAAAKDGEKGEAALGK